MKDDEIKERWRVYFEKLLNEKQEEESSGRDEYDGNNVTQDFGFYRRIQKAEVEFCLRDPSIPIEVWRSLGEEELHWLTKVFYKIIMTRKILKEWRRSIIETIYKNQGDIQCCNKYRGIKLMS